MNGSSFMGSNTAELASSLEERLSGLGNSTFSSQKTRLETQVNDYSSEYFEMEAAKILGFPSIDLAKALEDFKKGKIDSSFGISVLSKFIKNGYNVSEEELRKYEIRLDIMKWHLGHNFKDRYFDSVFNFCYKIPIQ
jgi:hypothetical protein